MDNRIRLPATKIDFVNDVGLASQDHDNYPPPQGQVRYDHMRMYLMGLLAQQSSAIEPSERRDGTPWMDMSTGCLKVWLNGAWRLYSEVVPLEVNGSDVVTLYEWYQTVASTIASLSSESFFAGTCSRDGISEINIPASLQNQLYSDSRAFVNVNGLLIDPREVELVGSPSPTSIKLTTIELENGDNYVVSIRRIPNASFIQSSVII